MGGTGAGKVEAPQFGVEFVDAGGVPHEGGLPTLWCVAFEDVLPVRSFRWARGQGHNPGWWWSASSGRHVGYESWLERDHAMLLDFDPTVAVFSSQPFWLTWWDGSRRRRHAPDYFARRLNGTGVVIDVRAEERIEEKDMEAFAATRLACQSVGWEFQRVGPIDPVLAANVRWLARYRHQRCWDEEVAAVLAAVFAGSRPLMEGARLVGDPLAVLPVLFHMMWRRVLVAELSLVVLGSDTAVWSVGKQP